MHPAGSYEKLSGSFGLQLQHAHKLRTGEGVLPFIGFSLLVVGDYHGVDGLYYLGIPIFYLMDSFLGLVDCFMLILRSIVVELEFLNEVVGLSKINCLFLAYELYRVHLLDAL